VYLCHAVNPVSKRVKGIKSASKFACETLPPRQFMFPISKLFDFGFPGPRASRDRNLFRHAESARWDNHTVPLSRCSTPPSTVTGPNSNECREKRVCLGIRPSQTHASHVSSHLQSRVTSPPCPTNPGSSLSQRGVYQLISHHASQRSILLQSHSILPRPLNSHVREFT
jgi:hypothetical protein